MSTGTEMVEAEIDNGGDYETLSVISAAEINQQISTAKRFPRSVKKFLVETQSLATENEEIAGECFYRLKRKDKEGKEVVIEGGSSRLAEIVAMAWGNCRCGSRIVEEGERFVTAQGVFHDLERNVAVTYETRRRITTKGGKRFGDDMIGVTCAAAASIALRNAVFKAIPKAFWLPALEASKQTYRGEASSLGQKRDQWRKYWAKVGVSDERLLAKLGKPNWESIDLDDCLDMRGYATALKDNSTTLDECFPVPSTTVDGDAGRSKADQLAEQLKQQQKSNGHAPEKPAETKTESMADPTNGRENSTSTTAAPEAKADPTFSAVVGSGTEPATVAAETAQADVVGPTLEQLKATLNARVAGKSVRLALPEISRFNKEIEEAVFAGQVSKDMQMSLLNYGLALKSKLGK